MEMFKQMIISNRYISAFVGHEESTIVQCTDVHVFVKANSH